MSFVWTLWRRQHYNHVIQCHCLWPVQIIFSHVFLFLSLNTSLRHGFRTFYLTVKFDVSATIMSESWCSVHLKCSKAQITGHSAPTNTLTTTAASWLEFQVSLHTFSFSPKFIPFIFCLPESVFLPTVTLQCKTAVQAITHAASSPSFSFIWKLFFFFYSSAL